MALWTFISLILIIASASSTPARKSKKVDTEPVLTCPGFPGYCSEAYPGDTCTVVCARGRNNVPECQEDGTWTDIPRCIEHEPGLEEQRTDFCPGIPGYCSLDLPGGLCEFACSVGPPIRSSCTVDGTWDPYPTCEGDPRETQDGCDPCPGPLGGPRNRTAEAGGAIRSAGTRGNNIPPSSGGRKQGGGGQRRNGGGNKNSGFGGGSNKRPVQEKKQTFGGVQKKQGGHGGGSELPRKSEGAAVGGQGQNQAIGQCPGDGLQVCIDACPGLSARVFGACVGSCAKRCPGARK